MPAVLDAFVAALQALREHWPRSVIVVDDLHFADDDSVKLIALLLDRDDRPGWLLSTRPETMPAALKAWLLAQPAEDEAQLEVPPLNVSHLASWLHALGVRDIDAGAWAGALLRHCGGHPLHTLQVLRELGLETRSMPRQPPADLPVPREAMLRLARRLDACAPETRRLAYCAAVGGGDLRGARRKREGAERQNGAKPGRRPSKDSGRHGRRRWRRSPGGRCGTR